MSSSSSRTLLGAALVVFAISPLVGQHPTEQRVDFTATELPLPVVLHRLRHELRIPLAWRGDQIPPRRITVSRREVTVAALLTEILTGTGIEMRQAAEGTIVLVPLTSGGSLADDAVASALGATGVQQLDQLVVTGSAVAPAAEREQPTAVTVVTQRDLEAAPHRRLLDQLRAFLPGVVLWDRGGVGPAPTLGAVRGVASFTARAPKVYVDGIEVASPELFTLLDGRMVSQLEMIHGPQGAALYGPDALNGVLQVETRRGTLGPAQVAGRGAAVTGVHRRTSDGSALWQEGAAGVEAGGERASFEGLVSMTRLGAAPLPLADAWRIQGGGQIAVGSSFQVNASARAASYTGVLEGVTPSAARVAMPPLEERGAGVRAVHRLSERASHSLVFGAHRISGSREPFRSPILPPRLPLGATNETASRRSARWAGDWRVAPLTLSGGVEASRRELRRAARVNLDFAGLSTLYQESLDSRGAFLQARAQFGTLTLTAGARTERISSVGVAAEHPWAATLGASWTTAVGASTLRLRTAWGRALRAPEPGMSVALHAGTIHQDANAALLAERQAGVELGADLYAVNGAWARVTWFSQRASDLIQQVDLRRPSGTTRYYQFQNVGAFTNRGVEMDGGVRLGEVAVAGRAHLVTSRVAALAPTYTGEFLVGDTPLEVPRSSAALAIRHPLGAGNLEVGGSWVGPWTGYDWQMIAKAERGESPVRDRVREYRMEYPGVLRPFVGVTLPIRADLALWARAEAPLGQRALLRDNLAPALGRTLLIGLELR